MEKIIILNHPIENNKKILAEIPNGNSAIDLIDVNLLFTSETFDIIQTEEKCLIIASCNYKYYEAKVEFKQAYYICQSNNNYWLLKPEEKNIFLKL